MKKAGNQYHVYNALKQKNIWMIQELQDDGSHKMIGKLLMYVDGVLALGPTKIVERVLLKIKEQWALSIK